MSKFPMITIAVVSLFSATAFAASGEINIPGVGSIKGSGGSKVTNTAINVMNNKSSDVTLGGATAGGYGVQVSMASTANINSAVISNSKVDNSTISVMDNESNTVHVFGGTTNINSVSIN